MEADSIPAIFVDSDFNAGGTDHKGQKFWFSYSINDNSLFSITYFKPKALKVNRKDERNTLQFDFITKL